MKMGVYSSLRNYFEEDTSFPDALSNIIDAYEGASRNANISAMRAIKYNNSERLEIARWHEACAQTIERCLESLVDDCEIDLPIELCSGRDKHCS